MMSTSTGLRPEPGWAGRAGFMEPRPPTGPPAGSAAIDRFLMVETVYRFAFAFGERQLEALTECFTEDASFRSNIGGVQPIPPARGRAEVVGWLISYWPKQTDQRRHLVTNATVDELNGVTGTVTALLVLALSENGRTQLKTAGFYRTGMVKCDDSAWRIKDFMAGYDAAY